MGSEDKIQTPNKCLKNIRFPVIRQKKWYFLESNSFKKVQVNCATLIDELFP